MELELGETVDTIEDAHQKAAFPASAKAMTMAKEDSARDHGHVGSGKRHRLGHGGSCEGRCRNRQARR